MTTSPEVVTAYLVGTLCRCCNKEMITFRSAYLCLCETCFKEIKNLMSCQQCGCITNYWRQENEKILGNCCNKK